MLGIAEYMRCCHARILYGFGSGHLYEDDEFRKISGTPLCPRESAATIKQYLDARIPGFRNTGIQVIFACPTNHQPEAIQALSDYGFFGAPEEDLLTTNQPFDGHATAANGYTVDKKKPIHLDHYMVPMFYLIPRVAPKPEDIDI